MEIDDAEATLIQIEMSFFFGIRVYSLLFCEHCLNNSLRVPSYANLNMTF